MDLNDLIDERYIPDLSSGKIRINPFRRISLRKKLMKKAGVMCRRFAGYSREAFEAGIREIDDEPLFKPTEYDDVSKEYSIPAIDSDKIETMVKTSFYWRMANEGAIIDSLLRCGAASCIPPKTMKAIYRNLSMLAEMHDQLTLICRMKGLGHIMRDLDDYSGRISRTISNYHDSLR